MLDVLLRRMWWRPTTMLTSLLFGLFLISPEPGWARFGGITTPEMPNGRANCSNLLCHPVQSADVRVTIEGPLFLTRGQSEFYTVSMVELMPGALQVGAGLNVSIEGGAVLDAIDLNTVLIQNLFLGGVPIPDEITHTLFSNTQPPPQGSVGDWSYDVQVTAPDQTGPFTIWTAMNAFNQNGLNTGDNWTRSSLEIQVVRALPEPPCEEAWPPIEIVTIGKGQSAPQNAKVSHRITGNILNFEQPGPDPVDAGTLHRVKICEATPVSIEILCSEAGCPGDSVPVVTKQVNGNFCNSSGCEIGSLDEKFKYVVRSSDGKDSDAITLLPQP